jgi:hypothetical protein
MIEDPLRIWNLNTKELLSKILKKTGKDINKFTITIVSVLYGGNSNKEDKVKDLVKLDKVGIILY